MIARVWKGRTRVKDRDRYLAYLRETGIRDCQATEGNQGVFVLRRDLTEADETEFVFVSLWESMESIAAFAPGDVEEGRFYGEDKEFLVWLQPRVRHFEVAFDGRS